MADADSNREKQRDESETGEKSVQGRVGSVAAVSSHVPSVYWDVSQAIAHTGEVTLILSHSYRNKKQCEALCVCVCPQAVAHTGEVALILRHSYRNKKQCEALCVSLQQK